MYGITPYLAFIDGIKNDDANFNSAAYFFPKEKCQENTIIVHIIFKKFWKSQIIIIIERYHRTISNRLIFFSKKCTG